VEKTGTTGGKGGKQPAKSQIKLGQASWYD
jgi:hypothetical protein